MITTISLDHVPILGTTIAEIAGEKAGIIKEGRPVVCSLQPATAQTVIHAVARQRHAPVTQVGDGVKYQQISSSFEGQKFLVSLQHEPFRELEIPLLGPHQIENAVTAYAALRVAAENGLPLAPEAIRTGFAHTTWPGRFEIFTHTPIPIILDAAHNQDSARRLRETLEQYYPARPAVIVFGVSGDKNVREMLAEWHPSHFHLETPISIMATQSTHARAMPAEQLAALAAELGFVQECSPHLRDALVRAWQMVPSNGLILITGSVFVAGEARTYLQSNGMDEMY